MPSIEFSSQPLWLNCVVLAVGGLIVCVAGAKLAKLADKISAQTGMSRALAGALLLGVATSLPEIVTTMTAAALGNASHAANNLFGGVAMQLVVLAAIDFFVVRNAPLTFGSSN